MIICLFKHESNFDLTEHICCLRAKRRIYFVIFRNEDWYLGVCLQLPLQSWVYIFYIKFLILQKLQLDDIRWWRIKTQQQMTEEWFGEIVGILESTQESRDLQTGAWLQIIIHPWFTVRVCILSINVFLSIHKPDW